MALKDVKDHLSEVVDQVEREHDRVVITKHGRPAAVVVRSTTWPHWKRPWTSPVDLMRQIRASLPNLQPERPRSHQG